MNEASAGGEIVRAKRQAKRRSLRSVCNLARLSQAYLSDIERGNRRPSCDTIKSLARILELDPDDLCAAWGVVPPDVVEMVTKSGHTIREVRELLRETK